MSYLPKENSTCQLKKLSFWFITFASIWISEWWVDFFYCGDFNSRWGDEHDYIAGGDEYDYIAGIDDVSVRSGLDFTRNSHCNTFIELFTSVNCCMLNGRVGNDNDSYMCFL
jgi:hypothetical protein